MDDTIESIVDVTHATPIAKLTAMIHNKALVHLLETDPEHFDKKDFLQGLLHHARILEERFTLTDDSDEHMAITPILHKLIVQEESISHGKPYTPQKILDEYRITLSNPELKKKSMKS